MRGPLFAMREPRLSASICFRLRRHVFSAHSLLHSWVMWINNSRAKVNLFVVVNTETPLRAGLNSNVLEGFGSSHPGVNDPRF